MAYLKKDGNCIRSLYIDIDGYVVDLENEDGIYVSAKSGTGLLYSKETKQIYFLPLSVYWNEDGIMYHENNEHDIPATEISYEDVAKE